MAATTSVRRPVALHGGVHHAEPHLRPAQLGVAEHVFLGVGVRAGDQPDGVRQEREALLALGREQALGRQLRAQPLEPLQEVAEADVAHVGDLHGEAAALDPVVGLDRGDHPVALLEVGGDAARTDDQIVNEIVASSRRSLSLP